MRPERRMKTPRKRTAQITYSVYLLPAHRVRLLQYSDTLSLFHHNQQSRRSRESIKYFTRHLSTTPIHLYPPSDKQYDALWPSFSFLPSPLSVFHPTTLIVPSRPCPPNTTHTLTSILLPLQITCSLLELRSSPTFIRRKRGRRCGAREDD